ncbi:VOC family protein [Dactylosporangium siamense]|uniref:VOC family protein n=1 Tax=Dactylosporangium siamense TaxID=685454 RepID=UPI001944222A|nr:VOC family protein [Dactylosporangium siamense]
MTRSSGLTSPLVYVGDGPDVLVYAEEGGDTNPHRHGRPGLQHIAFAVDSPGIVNAAHQAAVDAGGAVVHEPQIFPYIPGYHAAFVEDPDGSRIEIVHIPACAA